MGKLTVDKILERKIIKELNLMEITEHQVSQLNNIINNFDAKTIKNRLVNIRDFLKYKVSGDWLDRINIIRTVLKNDVTSDYALEIRYGKENVEVIKNTFKEKFSITLKRYVENFGEIDGTKKWEEYKIKSKTAWGLKACIHKFGEIDGPKKWEERLSKKVETMKERKKLKPYRNGRTLEEYQNRYGIEDGFTRWKKRNDTQSYRFSIQYYIGKYGDVDGLKKWNEYKKCMDNTSLISFIERYGKEVGEKKYKLFTEKLKHCESKRYYSKISQDLFWKVYDLLDDKSNVRFAELNKESFFYPNKEWRRVFAVDFKYGNKIIEFDGDYWHDMEETKILDNKKDDFLTENGYSLLRIRESVYKKNPEIVINDCINFLNK